MLEFFDPSAGWIGEKRGMVDSPRGSRASRRKTPTIYDVAREARVSVFTVSAVINNKSHVGATLK
jgi:hypothetical protein